MLGSATGRDTLVLVTHRPREVTVSETTERQLSEAAPRTSNRQPSEAAPRTWQEQLDRMKAVPLADFVLERERLGLPPF
jgi:hypothetical protein